MRSGFNWADGSSNRNLHEIFMRTHKDLYKKISSFQNIFMAAKLAQKGKRFKDSTCRFNFHLERELWSLQKDLLEKTYEPGGYHHFVIYEPKKRIISSAPYRDRVVHHALHTILEPIFDPTFIYDSYATRKGKGTHAAIDRFQSWAQKYPYVLKCDIQKYFPSIDQEILIKLLQYKIACPDTLWLIHKILRSHELRMADYLHPSIHPSIHPSNRYPYWQFNVPVLC